MTLESFASPLSCVHAPASPCSPPDTRPMKLVCLSDTHGLHAPVQVPDGDILIHAGDVSDRGR